MDMSHCAHEGQKTTLGDSLLLTLGLQRSESDRQACVASADPPHQTEPVLGPEDLQ